MTEEKDDFLREIDELLGDIEDDPNSTITPLANGSTHDKAMGDVDPELEETFKVLSVHSNHLQAAPKTGLVAYEGHELSVFYEESVLGQWCQTYNFARGRAAVRKPSNSVYFIMVFVISMYLLLFPSFLLHPLSLTTHTLYGPCCIK